MVPKPFIIGLVEEVAVAIVEGGGLNLVEQGRGKGGGKLLVQWRQFIGRPEVEVSEVEMGTVLGDQQRNFPNLPKLVLDIE
jgi:hypothetical protein